MATRKVSQEFESIINKKLNDLATTLATKDSINDLKGLIIKQNEQICNLQNKINQQDEIISQLNDKIGVLTSSIEAVKLQSDCNEQYSRRYCLRLSGISKDEENENAAECVNKVVEVCKNLNLNINASDIDRAHRIGKDKKSVIVKFFSFKKRTDLYKARKKSTNNRLKIYLDLTKSRLALLDKARTLIDKKSKVEFVFADINCNPCAKLKNGAFVFFNSIDKFYKIISIS